MGENIATDYEILVSQGRFYEAIQILKSQLETQPLLPIFMAICNCFYQLNDLEKAWLWGENGLKFTIGQEGNKLGDNEKELLKFMGQIREKQEFRLTFDLYSAMKGKFANFDAETSSNLEKLIGSAFYQEVNDLIQNVQVEENQLWYLIQKEWYDQWFLYETGQSNISPKAINNSDIIEMLDKQVFLFDQQPGKQYTNIAVQSGKIEKTHFVVIPREAYILLDDKFGHDETEIKRWSIALNDDGSMAAVEIHLKTLEIAIFGITNEIMNKKVQISRRETIKMLKDKLSNIILNQYDIDVNQTRAWRFPPNFDYKKLINKEKYPIRLSDATLLNNPVELEDAEIADNDVVLLEVQGDDKKWYFLGQNQQICENCGLTGNMLICTTCKMARYCNKQCQVQHYPKHKEFCKNNAKQKDKTANNGLCGLQNLGNTCFMSSAIQCVSHTLELTQYFLDNHYRKDINQRNPLGTGGQIANSYAELMREMWRSSKQYTAAWNFKKTIAYLAPQFLGFQQHDSHELLSYLLDGLHEDLNRIKNKPQTENEEANGRPDEQVAQISWEKHLSRNQSIIVDLMHGQCKSTLVCPDCGRISITFDPVLTYTVNIPKVANRQATLEDCLTFSQQSEKLDQNNEWYCSQCKSHVQATKTYQIYKTPKIMIIHFKRFKSRGYWNEKLNSLVDFPLTDFDMSPFTLSSKEPQIYDLYGVSNHYGGLGGGHYTAYVYSNFLDSWIEMDDTRVRKISPKKVVSSSAYILFYKRRDSQIIINMECPGCQTNWNNNRNLPRILKCGHSLCQACIQQLIQQNQIQCPNCSHQEQLTHFRIEGENQQQLLSRVMQSLTVNISLLNYLQQQRKGRSNENLVMISREYVQNSICPDHNLMIHSYTKKPFAMLCDSCISEIQNYNLEIYPYQEVVSQTRNQISKGQEIISKALEELNEIKEQLEGQSEDNYRQITEKLEEHFQILKMGLFQAHSSAKNKLTELVQAQELESRLRKETLQKQLEDVQQSQNQYNNLIQLQDNELVRNYQQILDLQKDSQKELPQVNQEQLNIEVNINDDSVKAIRELIAGSYMLNVQEEEVANWQCDRCNNNTPDGTLQCKYCRNFRPLETYPNILHNPANVTLQEIRELEQRRQIELEMISKLDYHTGPQGVWFIINADWITEWKSFIFNKQSHLSEQNSKNERIGVLPPAQISNDKLYKDPSNPVELRDKLKPVAHYRGVNDKVWGIYYKIYGGGPVIVRQKVNIYDEPLKPPDGSLDRSFL